MQAVVCALILLSSFSLVLGEYAFKAEHCEDVKGANYGFKILDVKPKSYPFVVPGSIEAAFKFNITKALVKGRQYQLKFDIKKSYLLVDLHVPCRNGRGSCTYDFCDFLATKSKELAVGGKCQYLPCSCDELKPGVYDVPNFKLEITQEMIDHQQYSSLFYGNYKVDVTLVRKDTQETMGCVHLEFSLTKDCTGIFCL